MSHVLVRVGVPGDRSTAVADYVLAIDGLAVIGTLGFFLPAAILVALVTGAVIRDRRLHAREQQEAEDEHEPTE